MVEDTRVLILKKAAELFLESGYDATSIKELAKFAGIQAPGIYYYFDSKEEILAQLQQTASRRFRENVIDEVNKASDPEERVKILISSVLTLLINFGEIPLLMLQNFLPAKSNEKRKKTAQEFTRFVRDTLDDLAERKGIERPIDPTVATFCLIAMTSWTHRWYDPKGRMAFEALIDHTIRQFLYGFYAGEVPLSEASPSSSSPFFPYAPKQDAVKRKKNLLLKKAAQLFLEYGFHGTSLRKIAELAGMRTPALYYYFKNKGEILSQLQETGAQRFRENVIEAIDRAADPEEKIRTLMSRVVTMLINDEEMPLLMVQDFSSHKPNIAKKKRDKEFVYLIRTMLQELAENKGIKEPVDPTVATYCLISITSWICRWYNPRGRMDVQALTASLTRMFFQGFYGGEVVPGAMVETKEVGEGRPTISRIIVTPGSKEGSELLGGRCFRCAKVFFPKEEICPDCSDTGVVEIVTLSRKGKLASYTVVREGLESNKAPYAIGYIDTPEQLRVIAPLTQCNLDELRIDMEMEVVIEKETGEDGVPVYVYKYRPF